MSREDQRERRRAREEGQNRQSPYKGKDGRRKRESSQRQINRQQLCGGKGEQRQGRKGRRDRSSRGQGGERCRQGERRRRRALVSPRPGVKVLGRGPRAQCSLLHLFMSTGAVCSLPLHQAGRAPRASCPLGSLRMSGGGRRWRKQLQE